MTIRDMVARCHLCRLCKSRICKDGTPRCRRKKSDHIAYRRRELGTMTTTPRGEKRENGNSGLVENEMKKDTHGSS